MKKFLLSILAVMLAVFSVQAEEVTYTVTSTSAVSVSGTAPVNSSATYKSTYNTKSQLTSGNSMTLTLKGYAGCTITGIKMSMKSNTSKGKGSFSAKAGSTTLSSIADSKFNTSSWAGKWSTSYIDVTPTMSNGSYKIGNNEDVVITIAATENSLYCQSFTITYKAAESGETPEPVDVEEPIFNPADGSTFDETLEVTINAENGLTTYYSLNNKEGVYTEGSSVEISATTTIYAYAQDANGNKSDIVSATYTKNIPVDPNAKTATLSFASTDQRLSQDGNSQVWSNEGITFTNNKAASTAAVVSNFNPVRLYKSSEIIVECALGNIVAIEFDCDNSDNNKYLTPLRDVITGCSVNEDKVTVALDGTSNKYELSLTAGQVRLDAITVTYLPGATKPVNPTLTAGGNFVGLKTIEISCATEGAKIYYTTNGEEPTAANGTEYSAPFEITETTTVKAIAVNEVGNSDIATATYTRVAATPAISFKGEATFEESIEVTVNAAEGTTAYYTLSGSNPTNKSTEYTEPLTIKADATLKVIAYDEDGYKSEVVEQKFVMATGESAGAAAGTATLVESVADLAIGDQIVIVAADYNFALSTTQNDNNRGRVAITKDGNNVTLVDNVQILTLEEGTVDGTFAFNTGSGYLYAASSSSNYLRTQTTNNANGSWSIEIASGKATIEAQGANTRNLLKYNNNNSLFSCYSSGLQDVSIYKVNIATIEDYILNVTDAGWATLFLGHNVVIPDDVTCYVIDEIDGTVVNLNQVEGVLPANTAVIIEAEEGEYTFEATEETATVENVMAGTLKNEYITKEAYVLGADEDGVVGLYKADMAGGVWLNNANKAYLPASALPAALQGAASFSFRYEGTTSIEEVETENAVKAIYDLTGRKVEVITAPGIYIVNGVKRVVR